MRSDADVRVAPGSAWPAWTRGWIGAAAAGLLLLTAACSSGSQPRTAPTPVTSSTLAVAVPTTVLPLPTVTVETLRNATPVPAVSYTVRLPQLGGLADAQAQQRFDQDMRAAVAKAIDDFDAAASGTIGDPSSPPSTFTGTNDVTLLDSRIAAFRLTFVQYLSGAAHPTTSYLVFNFDLAGGRFLALSDLFRRGAPYLQLLSDGARQQLAGMAGYDAQLARAGTDSKDDNFMDFSLTPTGLEILFPPYQVAAGAAGSITVRFPYSQLRPLLATPGPLDGR